MVKYIWQLPSSLYATFVVLLSLLFGCATVAPIDTFNKRLASFEILFQETIKMVILYRKEGRISNEELVLIKNKVNETNTILNTVYSVKASGQDASTDLAKAQAVLQIIRNILVEKQNGTSKYNFGFRHTKCSYIYYGACTNFNPTGYYRRKRYYRSGTQPIAI